MKRILALLLCFCLCVSLIPAASAEDPDEIFVLEDDWLEGDDDLIDVVDPEAVQPPAEPTSSDLIASGSCGLTEDDDLVWKLYSDGELRIVGTGEMADYHWFEDAPWKEYDDPEGDFRITRLTIGEGVTRIGYNAFSYMDALTSAYLPASLEEISPGAFGSCHALSAFSVASGNNSFCTVGGVLFNCSRTVLVLFPGGKLSLYNFEYTVPEGTVEIADGAFMGNQYLVRLNVPSTLRVFGESAFEDCTRLQDINLSYGVTELPRYLFRNCEHLYGIYLPPTVTTIAYGAFENCTRLSEIYLPENLQTLEVCAFIGSGLTYVEIPDRVTKLATETFMNCPWLETVVVGSGVTEVGDWVFDGCESLERVIFKGHAPTFVNFEAGSPDKGSFCGASFKALYPAEDRTWNSSMRSGDYGGNVTWEPYTDGLYIKIQPVSNLVYDGWTAYFSFRIGCAAETVYQWQYKTPDALSGSWKNVPAEWTDENANYASILTVPGTMDLNGARFRCKITSGGTTLYTDAVNLTVKTLKPTIITQPKNQAVAEGETATFTTKATGQELVYEWQYNTDPDNPYWRKCTGDGANTPEMPVVGKNYRDGYQYRCCIYCASYEIYLPSISYVYTKEVTLTLLTKPAITTQPKSITAYEGDEAVFTVKAGGSGLSYQWQYRTSSSGSWKNSTGADAKTKSLTVAAASFRSGYQYRCKVTNAAGTTTSNAATLTVKPVTKPEITAQPKAVTATAGSTVSFTVTATGGKLSYQWQFMSPATGLWSNCSDESAATKTLTVEAKSYRNGYQYRCKVTNTAGTTTSSAAALTVTIVAKPTITTQPASASATVGENASFTVAAKGTGTLSYQWYYRANSDNAWAKCTNGTGKTLTVEAKSYRNGYQYRCGVTNAGGTTYTKTVTLTVKTVAKPEITKQPASVTYPVGGTAVFTVAATGTGTLSYQWYYRASSDNAWAKCTNGTGKTLTVEAKGYRNGYQYRCGVTNEGGTVYTVAVTLTVTGAQQMEARQLT